MSRKIYFIIFSSMLFWQLPCLASTKLEWLNIDSSQRKTVYDAYGLPSVTYAENIYPMIEYKFDGSFIDTVVINSYLKNSGEEAETDITVTVRKNKTKKFALKAGNVYVLRVPIKLINTSSWGKGFGEDYHVNIKLGNIEKNISFRAEHARSIEFDFFLDDLPSNRYKKTKTSEAEKAGSVPPDLSKKAKSSGPQKASPPSVVRPKTSEPPETKNRLETKTSAIKRIALVVGNSAYHPAPLRNPIHDAEDIGSVLTHLGFNVTLKMNADKRTFEDAIRQFGQQLRNTEVGLFYFAGHGMQIEGRNFLIPVNARIESESDVKYEAVDAGFVLSKMEDAKNQMNIMILDACRNNPFSKNFRASERGLARMDAPTGSLIVYATAPGEVAADGLGRNGIFTKHLLRHVQTPDLPVEQVLKRVRIDVAAETHQRQIPWESSSLMGDFFFAVEKGRVLVEPAGTQSPLASSTEVASLPLKPDSRIDKIAPKIKLAIFPIYLFASHNMLIPTIDFIDQFVKSIKKPLAENKLFDPIFSYYDLKKEFQTQRIPADICNEETLEKIWQGSFFSKQKRLNLDLICNLGTQLQIDAVLVCWFYIVENEQIMQAYLINVKNRKIFHSTDADDFGKNYGWGLQYYNELPKIAKELLSSVFEQFQSVK
jgi:hypothetical protein